MDLSVSQELHFELLAKASLRRAASNRAASGFSNHLMKHLNHLNHCPLNVLESFYAQGSRKNTY